MGFFETLEKWENEDGTCFNIFEPTTKELNKILSLNPSYFLVPITKVLQGEYLDYYSQYELKLLKPLNRDNIINLIIKQINN
jgi:hypothetical protein